MNESLFCTIERYLDEHSCVTYRTLASTMKCNVNIAKSGLLDYLKLHPDVKGLYVISGMKKDVYSSFCLVDQADLEEAKTKYDKIENIDIYSIYRSSFSILTEIAALDSANFHEWNAELLSNSIGNIHLSGIQIFPIGHRPKRENSTSNPQKQTPTQPPPPPLSRPKSAPKQKSESKEVGIPSTAKSFFEKKSNTGPTKPSKKSSDEKPQPALPPLPPPQKQLERPPKSTTSTTSTTSTKSTKPTKSTKSESQNPLIASSDEDDFSQQSTNENGETSSNKVIEICDEVTEDDVEEDEWVEGGFNTGEKYVLNKEKIKSRDEIQSINSHFLTNESSSDEELEEDEGEVNVKGKAKTKGKGKKEKGKDSSVSKKGGNKGKKRTNDSVVELSGGEGDGDGDGEENEEHVEKKSKKPKNKKAKEEDQIQHKVQIHGAMDDFFEDMAKKNGTDGNGTVPKKKKKTKLVEKVFADEKGYLVTEMVYEEVSDNEGDSDVVVLPTAAQRTPSTKSTHDNHDEDEDGAGAGDGKKNKDSVVKETKKKTSSKQTPAATTAAKGQQRSMMSYFTKK